MTLPRRGILVAIEGIDGAGKTTLVARLQEALSAAGLEVVRTKEPTDQTEAGRRIRASAATERLPLAEMEYRDWLPTVAGGFTDDSFPYDVSHQLITPIANLGITLNANAALFTNS